MSNAEQLKLLELALGGMSFAGTPRLARAAATLKDLAGVFFPFAKIDSPDLWNDASDTITLDEEALPDLNSRYRVLVEQIPAIVFMSFLDRGISEAYVSPQIEAMLGFTQAEWLQDPVLWFEQLHEEDKTRWSVEAAQMFLTGEPLRSTYRVRARDGRVVWFHCEAKLVRRRDGRPWFIHGVAFDVTELKQKEFERQNALNLLAESEQMLRSIFEFAPDSMIIVDADGKIERVNSQVRGMFGYEPEELIGKGIGLLMPERFRESHLLHQNKFLKRPHLRQMGSELELFAQRKDGTEFPADIILSPIRSEDGLIVVAVVRDITRRKRDELALRSYAEQQGELSRKLLNIQEAERRRIALELHDEIGQTLTGLKLTLEMQSRRTNAGDELAQAQTLVNDLMARVRQLSLDLRPATLDHLGLLPSLLWLIRNYTTQTGIEVDLNHHGISQRRFAPELETSAYRIVQEALTNVARHSGVKSATVRVWADDENLRVSVIDAGAGFDADETLASAGSTGLSGMRERVRLLGGQFYAESAKDNGTRISADWSLNPTTDEKRDPNPAR